MLVYHIEQMFRAVGVWAGPKVEGTSGWVYMVQHLRNDSVLLAFVLTTNAGSSVHFCVKETGKRSLLHLLAQIISL